MLENGSRLGDYEILDVLGRGQSAVTYRARNLASGGDVALKVAHPDLAPDPTFYFRFAREAALGRRLTHPSIVRVLDSGEEGELLFIAMEVVTGTLLSSELSARGRLPLLPALGIAREVADALAYAHGQGVVHRDLRPGHIMLVQGGGVKVMDLGVARDFGQVGLTRAEVRLGSPLYSAPESKDPTRLDHQSDLYSLGIILFEMLQGHPPYQALSPVEIMILHCTAPFPASSSLEVPVPRGVWELMDRLCQKQPGKRPRLAAEVVRELDRIQSLVGQRAVPTNLGTPPGRSNPQS
jgi:serine/threonine protein kinase